MQAAHLERFARVRGPKKSGSIWLHPMGHVEAVGQPIGGCLGEKPPEGKANVLTGLCSTADITSEKALAPASDLTMGL